MLSERVHCSRRMRRACKDTTEFGNWVLHTPNFYRDIDGGP